MFYSLTHTHTQRRGLNLDAHSARGRRAKGFGPLRCFQEVGGGIKYTQYGVVSYSLQVGSIIDTTTYPPGHKPSVLQAHYDIVNNNTMLILDID